MANEQDSFPARLRGVIREARERGYAVVTFTPDELDGRRGASEFEADLVAHGNELLDNDATDDEEE